MVDDDKKASTAAALGLRPLTTGELIDRGFQLYRRHFIPLFYFSAMIQALPFVAGLILAFFNQQPHLKDWLKNPHSLLLVGVSFLFSLTVLSLGEGALTFYIARLYLGQPVSIQAALQFTVKRAWAILYSTALKYLLIGSAFLLVFIPFIAAPFLHGMLNLWILFGLLLLSLVLVAPCLILTVRYLLMIAVIMLEKKSGWRALRRSSEVTRYDPGLGFLYWGETRLSILLLVVVVANLLVILVSRVPMLASLAGELLRGNLNPEEMSVSPLIMTVSYLLNFLGSSVIAPLYVIAGTLFYYDIRVRKEALDLELIAESLQAPDQPSSSSRS